MREPPHGALAPSSVSSCPRKYQRLVTGTSQKGFTWDPTGVSCTPYQVNWTELTCKEPTDGGSRVSPPTTAMSKERDRKERSTDTIAGNAENLRGANR